jgi:hypothetical protein
MSSYLRCLCLFVCGGVHHIVCCGFCFLFLFVFVLCLVCPTLPVFLDCPLLIAPSVFFNGYCICIYNI